MQLERSDSSDLAAVNAFLDEWEAVGESPAPAAAKTSRTRVRPQQELSRLRSEQRALASSLAQLRRAAQQAVERDDERGRGLSLAFWERAAARQAQRRVEAERENRRLRDQLQALARHSRRLQRALDRPALAPVGCGCESLASSRAHKGLLLAERSRKLDQGCLGWQWPPQWTTRRSSGGWRQTQTLFLLASTFLPSS